MHLLLFWELWRRKSCNKEPSGPDIKFSIIHTIISACASPSFLLLSTFSVCGSVISAWTPAKTPCCCRAEQRKSLEKSWTGRNAGTISKYVKVGCRQGGSKLFSTSTPGWLKNFSPRLQWGRSGFGFRKTFLEVKMNSQEWLCSFYRQSSSFLQAYNWFC